MFPRSIRIVSSLSVALLAGSGVVAQGLGTTRKVAPVQGERAGVAPDVPDASARLVSKDFVFEGFVLEPTGAPAPGAVVVTSAGGKAVTDTLGRYRIEARVPREAESVQVTAVSAAGRNRVASALVELPAASRRTGVAPLLLTEGTTCAPRWLPTFGGEPGTNDRVHALAVYDDGEGPAVYAGGAFTTAGGVAANCVAKWDGSSWSALDGEMNCAIYALAVYDDGEGAALYAAGSFRRVSGAVADSIAKWDGSSWSALGTGMTGAVQALAVYDDGGGPALYAGGLFSRAGGVAARNIAKWDGSTWTSLGSGVEGNSVRALAVYDDGTGEALYAGGQFTTAGGVAASRVAKWDGASWSALGSGIAGGFNGHVYALAVHDDGSGSALYAGGEFTTAGGKVANRVARWDGSSWSRLRGGMDDTVYGLSVHDDGDGPALYAEGAFTAAGSALANRIAKWDGSVWSALGSGLDGDVRSALSVYDGRGRAALYVAGWFTNAGGAVALHIAKWDGSSWLPLGSGLNGTVVDMTVYDDGDGPALYAGGDFTAVSDVAANRIAKWDGSGWSALGSGMDDWVTALTVYDDGGGPALYAGGRFTTAGGVAASRIAKWDGSSWSTPGGGVSGGFSERVYALAVYDDGGGAALYVGGGFTKAGGPANRIAKWDGVSWSPLGSGMNADVLALAVYDDGRGAALYAGGRFSTAGGVPVGGSARWDGSSWSTVGGGPGVVYDLTVYDDGGGAALYAVIYRTVVKWDGSSWSIVGTIGAFPYFDVWSLSVHDDGGGAALYAAGDFTTAGGVAANRIAKWDGSTWSALGGGMNDSVYVLQSYDAGDGAALYAGGRFSSALDSYDSYLARWACPALPDRITTVTRPRAPGAGGIRK